MTKKIFFQRLITYSLIVLLTIVGGIVLWLFSTLNTKVEHEHLERYIEIKHGTTTNQIIEILTKKNIIQSDIATRLYLRFINRKVKFQAGDFKFPSPISPMEAIQILQKGKKRSQSFTVPEGWTRFDIAKKIVEQFPSAPSLSYEDVLMIMKNTNSIKEIDPNAKSLEGYLYPSTYQIEKSTPAKTIIDKMVLQFKAIWKPEWDTLALKMKRTKREIVTIASLIEAESKLDSERPIIASVIYNRLERRIPLGIDATNVYIAKLQNRWDGIIHKSDLEVNHPYNTRKISGLPPGPINSPSKSAIEAALNPAKTTYLYYVLDVENNDGTHHFYATGKAFLKGKRAYQKWLSKQRRN